METPAWFIILGAIVLVLYLGTVRKCCTFSNRLIAKVLEILYL